ncbi:MAG: hypothetical protein ABTQ73_00240 [Caldilineales bacterium]
MCWWHHGHASINRILLSVALLIMLLADLPAPTAQAAALPCRSITWNQLNNRPAVARGCTLPAEAAALPAQEAATAFLRANAAAFGLPADLNTLTLLSLRHSLGSSHLIYQQTLAGRPVYDALLALHLNQSGEVAVIHSRLLPEVKLAVAEPVITPVQAVQSARQAIGFAAPRSGSPAPELVVLPLDERQARLAWRVMIASAQPAGDWEVLLDAASGTVIKRYNRLVFAKGDVYGATGIANADGSLPVQTVTLSGLDDSGWLRGDYVDVTTPQGYRPATAFSASGDFQYDSADPRFGEVMVYYYIDAMQRYMQALGYSNRNSPANGVGDRVTRASAHWFAQDQSFYSVSDGALHFGDGGVPDSLDPDVVVHEYIHVLLHDLAPVWGGGDMEALGEGYGDYFTASFFADSAADPACIGEIDSRSTGSRCLRRVDRSSQYPVALTGDPHQDGMLWSRVLWDVRASLGAPVADRLAWQSAFYLPPAASWHEAAAALLDADAALYRGAHRSALTLALQGRGLLPLAAPLITSPAGGEILRPGGLWAIAWQPRSELPVIPQLQWSLDAAATGSRRLGFSNPLPSDFNGYGAAGWQVQDDALRAGSISHNQHSVITLPVELVTTGQISFRYRVDSEQGYDFLEFLLDDVPLLRVSGASGWQTLSTTLPAGSYTLQWSYRKDSTVSSGQDSAWIDDLVLQNISLAEWQPGELELSRSGRPVWLWHVPDEPAANVTVRVRAQFGTAAGPWAMVKRPLLVDQPTAARVQGFTALAASASWPRWLLAGVVVGLLLSGALRRRRH